MTPPRPSLIPALTYQNPKQAVEWLTEAFGFDVHMLIEDQDGALVHSEMHAAEGVVMIGSEWSDHHKSPLSTGGKCTQSIHVRLNEDIDAHCARAKAAGAVILAPPETQFYGDRTYRAQDIEGHIWTFGATVQHLTPAEWDAAAGTRTRMA